MSSQDGDTLGTVTSTLPITPRMNWAITLAAMLLINKLMTSQTTLGAVG